MRFIIRNALMNRDEHRLVEQEMRKVEVKKKIREVKAKIDKLSWQDPEKALELEQQTSVNTVGGSSKSVLRPHI